MLLHPVSTKVELKPYQSEGVAWLVKTQRGILADPPGLGKTAQSICACDIAEHKKVLIVAPKSLLTHWATEIERFSTGVVQVLNSKSVLQDARWYIIGYEAACSLTNLLKLNWDCLVVDEAIKIKNRKAQRTKNIFKLARRSKHVYLLAGMLAPNKPDELWALLHTLDPKAWSSYWGFRGKHCVEIPVMKRGVEISRRVVGVKDERLLLDEIRPYILKRDKALLNLPEKLYETIHVGMLKEQSLMYAQMKAHLAALLQKDELLIAKNPMEHLIRLRQISIDPRLVDSAFPGQKTEVILELIENYEDFNILVFCTFAKYIRMLQQDLSGYAIPAEIITGAETIEERKAAEDKLNKGTTRVLLGTYGAMGRGLNLQAATVVVLIDKPWSPEELQQAEDRVHRMGQNSTVTIIDLHAKGTIDTYIDTVLRGKQKFLDVLETLKAIIAD